MISTAGMYHIIEAFYDSGFLYKRRFQNLDRTLICSPSSVDSLETLLRRLTWPATRKVSL